MARQMFHKEDFELHTPFDEALAKRELEQLLRLYVWESYETVMSTCAKFLKEHLERFCKLQKIWFLLKTRFNFSFKFFKILPYIVKIFYTKLTIFKVYKKRGKALKVFCQQNQERNLLITLFFFLKTLTFAAYIEIKSFKRCAFHSAHTYWVKELIDDIPRRRG